MTVSCDSKGYSVDTGCPDCAVLIEKTNSQAESIERLHKTIARLSKQNLNTSARMQVKGAIS